ncbi:hypothetical protein ACGFNU_42325 [Spirillospora sp. NPDC048911]|uniref:hypothetical protein n=1 Tax=Spirillospora sp. NPDC048911 TaxID=3364527 RepID=UPI003723FAEB
MTRRRIVILAGLATAAAAAAIVGLATVGSAEPEPDNPTKPVVHNVPSENPEKYWTQERRDQTDPIEMPKPPPNLP